MEAAMKLLRSNYVYKRVFRSLGLNFQYIEIRKDIVDDAFIIDELELRQYFEDSKQRFSQEERRQANHILFLFGDDEVASEARAQDVLNKLNQGDDFSDLALEYCASTACLASDIVLAF